MGQALVLNATYEPLSVVPTRRAVVLLVRERAELVHSDGRRWASQRASVPVPSVIRLLHYVKVPYERRVPLNRRAVFARDGHTCQYCAGAAENLDHVLPRCRGGAHTWENMGLPYLILQTMVGPDSVLTVEPGVQVLSYPGNDNLDVQGKLMAIGSASQGRHSSTRCTAAWRRVPSHRVEKWAYR